MAHLSTTMAVALALGCASALSACSDSRDSSYDGSSARSMRSGSTYGAPDYDCRNRTDCGDFGNPIPGTNATVGPGPSSDTWDKDRD
jgi:hypothetical protein